MKALIAVILIIVVAVAGYFGYRSLSKPKPKEQTVTEAQVPPETTPTTPPAVTQTKTPDVTVTNRLTTAAVRANPKTAKPQPTGDWKPKLDALLASTASPERKLQQIKELLSSLSLEEAEQAVQALAASVKDESFAFLRPLVVDPTLPEPVRDEFMVDLMNRPNSIKIPLFLEIARNPDHPDHESAYDTLEAFTGLKYGADWAGWEKGIEQWLKENPDRARKVPAPAETN